MADLDPDFFFFSSHFDLHEVSNEIKGSEILSPVTLYHINAKQPWCDFHGVPKGHSSGVHLGIN